MAVIRVDNSRWHETVAAIPVCVLPWNADEFAAKWQLTLDEFEEPGLGWVRTAVLQIGHCICLAEAHLQGPDQARRVSISVAGTSPDTRLDLFEILRAMELSEADLPWVRPLLGPARWLLYRLDDNGNEFLIERYQQPEAAETIRAQYEAKGHKQLYFVRSDR